MAWRKGLEEPGGRGGCRAEWSEAVLPWLSCASGDWVHINGRRAAWRIEKASYIIWPPRPEKRRCIVHRAVARGSLVAWQRDDAGWEAIIQQPAGRPGQGKNGSVFGATTREALACQPRKEVTSSGLARAQTWPAPQVDSGDLNVHHHVLALCACLKPAILRNVPLHRCRCPPAAPLSPCIREQRPEDAPHQRPRAG